MGLRAALATHGGSRRHVHRLAWYQDSGWREFDRYQWIVVCRSDEDHSIMIVIPAIDLRDGRCVRLSQGRKSDVTVYNENPVAVAKEFAAAGAQMIHVVDLDGAFGEPFSPNREVVKKIIEKVDVAIEFGGGVRSLPDVKELCDAGVRRVVLGTIAAESPELLKDFVDMFSTHICVGIDARDGVVMTHGWQTATPATAVDLARRVAACGVKRIVYTDI